MGFLDFFKGTGSPSKEGILGSVVHTTLGQGTLPIRQTAKSIAMDGVRALEGDQGAQQRLGGLAGLPRVDQFGTPVRPSADQVNPVTRNFLQNYGPQPNGYPQMGMRQQPATLGDVGAGLLRNFINLLAPQPGGSLDRLTRGAVTQATNAAIATTIAVGGVGAQAMPQNQPPLVGGQNTYSMLTPAAPAFEEAQTFAVRAPGPVETRPLDSPAVTTSVSPRQDFTAVAPPTPPAAAAPAVQAPAAPEFHAKSGDDVYARAQAYVAQNAPKPGGPT